jgi:hypothetical protein
LFEERKKNRDNNDSLETLSENNKEHLHSKNVYHFGGVSERERLMKIWK